MHPGATKTAKENDRIREEEAARALGVSLSSSYNSRYARSGVGASADGGVSGCLISLPLSPFW